MSALARAATMLAFIPQQPAPGITVKSLVERLRDVGHVAHHRSVQRDLVTLARAIPTLSVDARDKPYRWRWVGPCPWVAP